MRDSTRKGFKWGFGLSLVIVLLSWMSAVRYGDTFYFPVELVIVVTLLGGLVGRLKARDSI